VTARYTASYPGLRELMKGPEMQAVVREVAEKGKAFAESIAPVGDPRTDPHAGEYKASFEVTVTASGGVSPPDARAEAQLVNTSGHAARVEWQDGYHVLARTLDALSSL